ncbi:MAG: hypothetical protein MI807_14845 [Verrucomicrobiales bacterium]|nr:hypothetical protein [Verrucomicrobiales bacterium]
MRSLLISLLLLSLQPAVCEEPEKPVVSAPPAAEVERLGLDPFYKKYFSYRGFPIVGSEKVSDFAFYEAAFLIRRMLGKRQDIIDALVESKVRLAIMAPDEFTTDIPEHATLKPKVYWDKRARGLGASAERPAVSVGEENLLGLTGDPYSTESIMVHEFAHAVHLMGINRIDPDFQKQLENVFNRASLKGLWKGKYAGTNPSEYWAESVQSWFDTNRENDHDHNHVNTREELRKHDPEVAALVESIFGDRNWRYKAPKDRKKLRHLETFDLAGAPTFSWPADLVKAYEALDRGEGLKEIVLNKMAELKEQAASPESASAVKLRVDNESGQRITVSWIGFDGLRREYGLTDPTRRFDQNTFEGHLWVITGEDGRDLGWFETPAEDCRVVVK